MLLFYQVATRLSLTTCWQIVELQDDNKLLEQLVTNLLSSTTLFCKLSTSRWQLVNKLGTSSANTSCSQVVGTALIQVCCRFVTTCVTDWITRTQAHTVCGQVNYLHTQPNSRFTICFRLCSLTPVIIFLSFTSL
jgi:hypothetical protein